MYEGDTVTLTTTLNSKDEAGYYTIPITDAVEVTINVSSPDNTIPIPEMKLSTDEVVNTGGGKYTATFILGDPGKYTAVIKAESAVGQHVGARHVFFANPLEDE